MSKRWLYRLSAAAVFLLTLRLFAGWQNSSRPPAYSLSTGANIPLTGAPDTAPDKNGANIPPAAPSPPAAITITTETGQNAPADESQEVIAPQPHENLTDPVPIAEGLQPKVTKYLDAIFDPNNTSTDRLSCPGFNADRYAHLQVPAGEHRKEYFFALNLRQCADLLPRLMGSIVEAITFLGPQHTVLSIVEGNSDDGTLEILDAMKAELADLGVRYYLRRDGLDPLGGGQDRIGNLALLRSMAVEPLRNSRNESALSLELPGADLEFDDDAVVIFLNDVAACTEDIRTYYPIPLWRQNDPVVLNPYVSCILTGSCLAVELLHQRIVQVADMTCGMDWYHPGGKDHANIFYDVWVSRKYCMTSAAADVPPKRQRTHTGLLTGTLSGNTFFDINTEGSWERSESLFPYDSDVEARVRFSYHRPFQVFACWNGGVTFTAKPLLNNEINFRRAHDPECFQGEPTLFCKDMWFHGYGRIAAVPSVNFEYTDERGQWVKESRGFVHQWAAVEDQMDGAPPKRIEWKGPPDLVKCAPTWESQSWKPWAESLPLAYGTTSTETTSTK